MGMSSSQARLLNLTARMHQIEYKAAKLEAQKLQMANESSKVYQEYLNALDATKIQYSSLTSDGTITYIDATLNALENGLVSSYTGETSNTVLFLQDQDGKILVTPAIAEEYGLSESEDLGTLDEYLTGQGYSKSSKATYNVYEYQLVQTGTTTVDDTSNITSVTIAPISETSSPSYSPVACTTAAITSDDFADYIDGRTVTISDENDLAALSELSSTYNSLQSQSYILTSDIDMSSVSDWSSISTFSGTFDGNGYTISGLTDALFTTLSGATVTNLGLEGDITTEGNAGMLADTAINSTITNVSASGSVTTTNTSSGTAGVTGGLIGYAYGCTVSYCSADVDVDGSDDTADVGGLIGQATGTNTIEYCTASGDVSGGTFASGGLIGYLSAGNTVSNCSASGDVTGSSTLYYNAPYQHVGGLIGVISNSGRYTGDTTIENCSSTGDVTTYCSYANTGSFIGDIIDDGSYTGSGENIYLTNYYCSGSSDDGVDYDYYTPYSTVTATSVSSSSTSSDAGATLSTTTTDFSDDSSYVTMSSISNKTSSLEVSTTSIASNLYYALKNAGYSIDLSDIESWISSCYDTSDYSDDLYSLANINYDISQYLSGSSADTTLLEEIASAISDGTAVDSSSTTGYYGTNVDDSEYLATYSTDTTECGVTQGEVTIPSTSDIAYTLYALLVQNGYDTTYGISDASDVKSWLEGYSTADIANIYYSITQGSIDLEATASAIGTGTSYEIAEDRYNTTEWNITQSDSQYSSLADCVTYGTMEEAVYEAQWVWQSTKTMTSGSADSTFYSDGWQTEVEVDVDESGDTSYGDLKYVFSSEEEYWDTSDSDIANAMAVYYMAQRGVVIVTEEQASSTTWLTNMINCGYAVLTTFDPSQAAALIEYVENGGDISSLTDAEYNELLGIENTSVSTETCLQEVSDETNLKKAEAQYEADMKKIDAKDTKYDTQIAALETERDAISEEIDTLKTVASDNVERTFKLFS